MAEASNSQDRLLFISDTLPAYAQIPRKLCGKRQQGWWLLLPAEASPSRSPLITFLCWLLCPGLDL